MKSRLLIIIGVSVSVFLIGTILYPTINEVTFDDDNPNDIPTALDNVPPIHPELENLLCIGGRGYIVNEDCERIGKYDPATGLPIVENKEQCDMLDGNWNEKHNICDSKYGGK